MENDRIQTLLFAYFSGELSGKEENELMQWLQSDNNNKILVAKMADWWAMAHVPLFMSDMETDFKEHFNSLVDPVVPSKRKRFKLNYLIRIAASILIILTVGLGSYYIGKNAETKNKRIAYYETIVPNGSTSKVILPDKSVVWINAASSLKYHEDADLNIREIALEGEAYFEVATDSLKPFIVKTQGLDIKVLGTSFNVRSYMDNEEVDIVLVSGKVNISMENAMNETLTFNQKLSYNKESKAIDISVVQGTDYTTWTSGGLRFNQQSFPQIAKDLERKFNTRITIESDHLKKEIFSGSFTQQHTLYDILREVDVDKKYKWSYSGNEFIIRDK